MIGAIIGDVVGSRFEWKNCKDKKFELFHESCSFTDDSVMTIAVANAFLVCDDYSNLSEVVTREMVDFGRMYPGRGYGRMFSEWIFGDNHEPYNSFGNGAAMRVSACGYVAKTLDEAKEFSFKVTKVSHNHPEGIKGAEATAVAIFLARQGKTKEEIKNYIQENYYVLNFTLDDIRETYTFNETCQNTVPQAIVAFLESESFNDAIRNAISIGGDSDTIAAITGGIAQAYYGIDFYVIDGVKKYLDETLISIIEEFEERFLKNEKPTENYLKFWWKHLKQDEAEMLAERYPNYQKLEHPTLDIRWDLEYFDMEKFINKGDLDMKEKVLSKEEIVDEAKNYNDGYFKDALRYIISYGGASQALLQRRFAIGYSRSARMIDKMIDLGFIKRVEEKKLFEVVITPGDFEEIFGKKFEVQED